jgi:hypothetical protein
VRLGPENSESWQISIRLADGTSWGEFMSRRLLVGVFLMVLPSVATAGPKGILPRASADRYPIHAGNDGTKVGAALPSPAEVRKAFSFYVSGSCLVIEVALYPQKDKERNVSLADFSLDLAGMDTGVKPSPATAIAAKLPQQSKSPDEVVVTHSAEVGVFVGKDGLHSGHIEAEVGVDVIDGKPIPVSERDRAVAEAELTDRGLPEGKVSSPVAGYLYFPIVLKKKQSVLRLEYEENGIKVVLHFSEKPPGRHVFQEEPVVAEVGSIVPD